MESWCPSRPCSKPRNDTETEAVLSHLTSPDSNSWTRSWTSRVTGWQPLTIRPVSMRRSQPATVATSRTCPARGAISKSQYQHPTYRPRYHLLTRVRNWRISRVSQQTALMKALTTLRRRRCSKRRWSSMMTSTTTWVPSTAITRSHHDWVLNSLPSKSIWRLRRRSRLSRVSDLRKQTLQIRITARTKLSRTPRSYSKTLAPPSVSNKTRTK